MRRTDVRKVFPDATDEQVDAILNGLRDEINPLKANAEDLATQLAEANQRIEAHMSDEERVAAREQAAAEREREFLMRSAELDAKAIFVAAGFSEEDMQVLLPRVVGTDAEATKSAAQALVDLDAARRKAATDAARDELLKSNPTNVGGAGGEPPMTMAEFLALPYKEQLSIKEGNPNILRELK